MIQRYFAELSFSYVGSIRPKRDELGKVIEEFPQVKYCNERNLPLHKYGLGPFCRFQIAQDCQQSGVYVLTNDEGSLYVGECQNLKLRWGPSGYGGISPRNCYLGGQETNCRINNLIYRETKSGTDLDLWFHSIEDDKRGRLEVESKLLVALEPPWNK